MNLLLILVTAWLSEAKPGFQRRNARRVATDALMTGFKKEQADESRVADR